MRNNFPKRLTRVHRYILGQNFKMFSVVLYVPLIWNSELLYLQYQMICLVLTVFGIEASDDELDLPYIYWIQKMHKYPYIHKFFAGSAKGSTKPLSFFSQNCFYTLLSNVLRSRKLQRASLLLLTWIYYCRLRGMVNSYLRQTRWFRFPHHKLSVPQLWYSIFPGLWSFYLSVLTPRLDHHMNVVFWGPGDCPVSYSNEGTLWDAWNRHSESFMVDTGISFSNIKSPSQEC